MSIQAFSVLSRPSSITARFGGKPKAGGPLVLDKAKFRPRFIEAIRENSVHVNPRDVIPGSMEFHMWLLPNGELRRIPDMEHEQMSKRLYEKLQLSGSTFKDEDGTRFRERAIVEAGIVKVCSHDRQLQIAMPLDVTDAQTHLLYSLYRNHIREKLVWDIYGSQGQPLASSKREETILSWRQMMPTLRQLRSEAGL